MGVTPPRGMVLAAAAAGEGGVEEVGEVVVMVEVEEVEEVEVEVVQAEAVTAEAAVEAGVLAATITARELGSVIVKRLADGYSNVLDGVMRVDVQVALGLDVEIHHAVARDLVEHVLEERDAGGEFRHAGPVEIELDADLRLFGIALDFGCSFPHVISAPLVVPRSVYDFPRAYRWSAAGSSPSADGRRRNPLPAHPAA